MEFEDPEMIKSYISEIKKFTDLDEFKQIKIKDRLQHEFAVRELFPTFAQEHPFLFRKIANGDDLTMLYKMLDSITSVNNGEMTKIQVEQNLGNDLANLYVHPAMEAAKSGNVTVDPNQKKPAFSLPLSDLMNPDILNS